MNKLISTNFKTNSDNNNAIWQKIEKMDGKIILQRKTIEGLQEEISSIKSDSLLNKSELARSMEDTKIQVSNLTKRIK